MVAVGTIFLAIATIVLAVVTYCSNQKFIKEGERQYNISDSLVKKTERAVNAADRSDSIAKQSMITANTPYILVFIGNSNGVQKTFGQTRVAVLDDFIKFGKIPSKGVIITFTNIGKTPAMEFQTGQSVTIEKSNNIRPIGHSSVNTFNKGILFPGQQISQAEIEDSVNVYDTVSNKPLTQNTINLINSGQLKVLIRVVVNYWDIFGKKYYMIHSEYFDPISKTLNMSNTENEYGEFKVNR
jgi:hypothetical protein